MTETSADLYAALKMPFQAFHMDGRNDHGTHLIPLPASNLCYDEIALAMDPMSDVSEQIFSDAERGGYTEGQAIITIWSQQDGGNESPVYYWEYEGVSDLLTAAFYGTPDEQRWRREEVRDD